MSIRRDYLVILILSLYGRRSAVYVCPPNSALPLDTISSDQWNGCGHRFSNCIYYKYYTKNSLTVLNLSEHS